MFRRILYLSRVCEILFNPTQVHPVDQTNGLNIFIYVADFVNLSLVARASAQELRFQIQQFQVGGKRDSAFKVVVKSRESPLNQFRRSIFINRAHTGRVVNWNPSARRRFWFSPFSKVESGWWPTWRTYIIKYHGSSQYYCLGASICNISIIFRNSRICNHGELLRVCSVLISLTADSKSFLPNPTLLLTNSNPGDSET